jgi:hypothetical protein
LIKVALSLYRIDAPFRKHSAGHFGVVVVVVFLKSAVSTDWGLHLVQEKADRQGVVSVQR